MRREGYNTPAKTEPDITVTVDVAKIIKYLCVAGVLIVAIIFAAKCINNMLNSHNT